MLRTFAPFIVTGAVILLRAWQLSQRTFYWDDLVIPAKFRDDGLWAPYDGHLMPGSAAVQIAADTLAPLQWWLPLLLTLGATVVAAALWWRLLGRLADGHGGAPAIHLLAFTALMFSPFLGIASGWWSAGVNALAWQITAAGVGLLLLRPRDRKTPPPRAPWWPTVAASCVLLLGLLMTEKALSVVPALIGVAVVLRLAGRRVPALPFIAPALLTAGWAILYLQLAGRVSQDAGPGLDDIPGALGASVLPGVLGGPWSWDRWNPSPSFPTTPVPLQIGAAVVVASLAVAFVVWMWRTRRGWVPATAALILSAGYLGVIVTLLQGGRSGEGATDLLARGMHYYADWWAVTVLALVAAAGAAGSAGVTGHGESRTRATRVVAPVLASAFAVSSVASSITWVSSWSSDETGDYLAALRDSAGDPGNPLLDQNMPLEVLTPLVNPYNTAGKVAESLGGVADHTTEPRIITPSGDVVGAEVMEASRSAQGEAPDCGTRVDGGRPQIIDMDPALPFGDWTWEFTATADQPVTVVLTTPNGLEDESAWRSRAIEVPVDEELTTQWVNLAGGGGTIMVEVDGPPGSHVCVGSGAVGPLLPR
ncbi:MAG: hypothetical protein ACTIL2_09895 [Corynebacterium sp.]|uniref:hypothetical protein n=1 Tax=Corynebacterium sp. TaxID=1720 RepID=UPI003F9698C3